MADQTPPADAPKEPQDIDPSTVDMEEIALAVVSLINTLPKCESLSLSGLDSEEVTIVCKSADGEMKLVVDAQSLSDAADYLAIESEEEDLG